MNSEELLRIYIQSAVQNLQTFSSEEIRQFILDSLRQQSLSAQQAGTGPSPAADLQDFYQLLSKVMTQQQAMEGAAKTVKLVEEYSPTVLQGEIITFALRKREPATFSQDSPFGGVKNYKPILRETFPDPKTPGYLILVFGLLFDNLVELTCWALTNKAANLRALWLEDLILRHTWFFRQGGISQLLYFGREADGHLEVGGQRFHYRRLLYYVRTEKLYTITEKTIEDLLVVLKASS